MNTTAAEFRRLEKLALRVYDNHFDKTGAVMCRAHRDRHYLMNPGAFGIGEFGGTCELCK